MRYPIAIERGDRKHAYSVVVPDLPGCFSAGDSLTEAIENAREAITLWLNDAAVHGNEIPGAGSIKRHRKNPDFKGWIWAQVEIH